MNRFKDQDMDVLVERAKELECFYLVDEALAAPSLSDSLFKIAEVTSVGFHDYKDCSVYIMLDGQMYAAKPVMADGDTLQSEIVLNGVTRGWIKAMYPKHIFHNKERIFLPEEQKLLDTIANRIAERLFKVNFQPKNRFRGDWEAIITLLQNTNRDMLLYVCEKMLALLAATSPSLVDDIFDRMDWKKYRIQGEINFPLETLPAFDVTRLSQLLFCYAGSCLEDASIYNYISLWIYQGKTYELIKKIDKKDADLKDITHALSQYMNAVKGNEMVSEATKRWLTVELIQRFLTDKPTMVANAQKYISIEALCNLLDNVVCSPKSIGKIGGKGTGFFIANQIISAHSKDNPEFSKIKAPKTWYITSDELSNLIERNGLDELNEHKYRDILEIRTSYPRIIQMMKNSKFSSYILNELGQILDSCEGKPLIVRSSSVLEDQVDTSFSGKYKSLFITNTGTKAQRLQQLAESILEVYASLFNPDSIQYRKERNLIDCSEHMGIMIQEVAGTRVGPYFFPLYAGVAFSNNELRWSPRIKREDGLLRMVMGLGTRAVDRIGDDYPILISPGQPNLPVNHSAEDLVRYSPQKMDVLDVENNRFLTLPIAQVIKEYGNQIPHINYVASIRKEDILVGVNSLTANFKSDELVITFDHLIRNTSMIKQIQSVLVLLKEKLGYPVDIEFASDGDSLYLLQCRPQSRNYDNKPVAIPPDISYHKTVFTADKFISNGKVTGIKTVIYVDPAQYSALEKREDLVNVAYAVSHLNSILPRKSFILMGPGRWGSRGDIKLGVPVAYSDINNTAMLIEIAAKESRFQPELSFGTHFFQDLVEENIKYLPLYPEDKHIIFNKSFFSNKKNFLEEMLPSYAHLSRVIRVIQVEEACSDKELVVLMNADLEKAIAYLDSPSRSAQISGFEQAGAEGIEDNKEDYGWKWRHYMAEQVAAGMDMHAYGVKGIYLFGSTNNCSARCNSDIDLILHFDGNDAQKEQLANWLEGWSMALSQMNYLKTGYQSNGLLDIHYVTDQDIADKTSYALKINSVYDPAFPLRIRD
ncbi:hypothetical protein HNQ56_004057 [Anaerotaenia torta]|uniref:PEP/pyruvate-binding domain-containing protein n=1 Tax=Anaerotaenia torta TaxID=433293 RepID=UPI003D23162A